MRNRDLLEIRGQLRDLPLQPVKHGLTRGNSLRQRGLLAGMLIPLQEVNRAVAAIQTEGRQPQLEKQKRAHQLAPPLILAITTHSRLPLKGDMP